MFFVFSGLLSEETPLELCAQDFNFVIQVHHSSNLLIIYLHWTLLSVDIEPNKNRAFIIPGGVSFNSRVTALDSNMPHRNPDSSAAVSSQSSTNPKLCSPKNAHCRSSKGKKTGAVGFFFFFLIEAGILSPSLLCTTWVQLRRLRPLVAPVSSSAPGWDNCPALIPALIIFKAAGFISHSCRRQWHRSSPRKQLFRLLPLLMRWAETATMDVSAAWTPLKHLASRSDLNLLQTFCTAQSHNVNY